MNVFPRRLRATLGWSSLLVAALVLSNCTWGASGSNATVAPEKEPTALSVKVVKTLAHDPSCFTQGFQWTSSVSGGGFYESCGEAGESTMRLTTLNGKVLKSVPVPDNAFAEGAVRLGNRLYQLTWRERVVFVRNPSSLALIETRALPEEIAEGWGLTALGSELVVSDGTSKISFLDPVKWVVRRTITVRTAGTPVAALNELELISGQIWANVWRTEQIVAIDPANGQVKSVISVAGLRPKTTTDDPEAVANGIAFDPKNKRIYLTGKNWPVIYQVTTKPA